MLTVAYKEIYNHEYKQKLGLIDRETLCPNCGCI